MQLAAHVDTKALLAGRLPLSVVSPTSLIVSVLVISIWKSLVIYALSLVTNIYTKLIALF